MTIIEINARENGSHNIQSLNGAVKVWEDGYIEVPSHLEADVWATLGWCDLQIEEGNLVGVTPTERPEPPDPEPKPPDLTQQYAAAMRAYAATSTTIPDAYSLDMPDLFPTWAVVLADGEELPAGRILNDEGQLYRVVQAVTPQEEMPPHDDGMLAIYRPIDREHAGTVDDPIPWVYGMDCHAGKHYSYNGKVYKVAEGGDMIPCTWAPDTPDMWQWVEV